MEGPVSLSHTKVNHEGHVGVSGRLRSPKTSLPKGSDSEPVRIIHRVIRVINVVLTEVIAYEADVPEPSGVGVSVVVDRPCPRHHAPPRTHSLPSTADTLQAALGASRKSPAQSQPCRNEPQEKMRRGRGGKRNLLWFRCPSCEWALIRAGLTPACTLLPERQRPVTSNQPSWDDTTWSIDWLVWLTGVVFGSNLPLVSLDPREARHRQA